MYRPSTEFEKTTSNTLALDVSSLATDATKYTQSKTESTTDKSLETPTIITKETQKDKSMNSSKVILNGKMNSNIREIPKEPQSERPKLKASSSKFDNRRGPLQQICDTDDIFGIHDSANDFEEFGTFLSKPSLLNDTVDETIEFDDRKATATNDEFDFSEECKTVRDEIIAINQVDGPDEISGANSECAVTMQDIENMRKTQVPNKDDSFQLSEDDNLSNHSTISTSDFVNLDDSQIDEMVHTATEEVEKKQNDRVFLASGSYESFIIIWNIDTGEICDKIQLKSHARNRIPSK